MQTFLDIFKKDITAKISLVLFLLFSGWWLYMFVLGLTDSGLNHLFGFSYGSFSLWGGMLGIIIGEKWGGFKSLIGRAIFSLSAGLLFQAFGQYSFWYLNSIQEIAIPYPGIPDLGYFGSIPFYIYAAFLLAKSAGSKVTLHLMTSRLQALIIPLIMLSVGYFLFLKDYDYDWSVPLAVFLDFGYPLGQAIYISIAILTFTLSRKILGGIMKFPILFILFAFMTQFVSDYTYVYFQESYYPGSFIDYFYLLAYFTMTFGLIQLKGVVDKLNNE